MNPVVSNLQKIDHQHLWHPFTQANVWETFAPLIVERAQGMELIDVEGKRYLDGVSSLWCNVHGHGVPEIVSAISSQVEKVCHSTLLGLSHEPILKLTEALLSFLPSDLSRVFYSDSGSAAVEAGLRMAIEYWQKQEKLSERKRTKFIALEGSYHGDTLGSVGVGYSEAFHNPLRRVVVQALKFPPPHYFRFEQQLSEKESIERSLERLETILNLEGDEIAALVIEPIVQGAAGIWVHSPDFLARAVKLCRERGALILVDEVATGFGKTGKMFAFDWAKIVPDILILGKGLSGGMLPLSAAVATEKIFDVFRGAPEELKQFFFGQTFSGNPLAAAAGVANLELFNANKVLESLGERIEHFSSELETQIASLPNVFEVRRFGLMTGIELTKEPGKRTPFSISELAGHKIVFEARKRGVIIRPLGNVIVLMPALAMQKSDLTRLVSVTAESIATALKA